MKKIYKIVPFAAFIMTLASCTESHLLSFDVEKPETIVNQEEINAYDYLKTYVDRTANPDFKLGVGISLSDYTSKNLMYRLVNNNFDQITLTTGMQHHDIVQSDGSFLMDDLNKLLTTASNANVSIFGNSLVWDKNQNGTYLNELLKPLTVSIKPYVNLLNKTSLSSNSLSGWTVSTATGGSVSVVDGKGLNNGKAIKLVSGSSSSSATDLQLTAPDINVISGHQYEVIMYVKSETNGEARFSFDGLSNNTPELDWTSSGIKTSTFETNYIWKPIKFTIKDFTSTSIKLHFDFGYKPNTTYYIDTATLYLRDLADSGNSGGGGSSNGDKIWLEAECGTLGNSGKWATYTNDATASEGKYVMVASATQNNSPSTSTVSDLITYDFNVSTSGSFTLYARMSCTVNNGADDSFHFKIDNGSWRTFNGEMTGGTTFTWYSLITQTLAPGTGHTITVAYREDGAKLDKLYITNGGDVPTGIGGTASNCGGVVIEANKSADEKAYIVNSELERWISGVVSNSKEVVKAWNVLNEPMDDANPTEVKSGVGVAASETQFFWQDYLGGKAYGVKAFKLAKENANPTDLLFISDYGLEENLEKCRGLIQYVEYLETNGAQVDGIASKMHLNVYSDKDNIATMFELLAATGKKIAISDFYVKILSESPTAEDLQLQSDMYRYVIDTYAQKVPLAQRYGITLSKIQDTSTDKSSLWDSSSILNRKPSYKGYAEGLKSLK